MVVFALMMISENNRLHMIVNWVLILASFEITFFNFKLNDEKETLKYVGYIFIGILVLFILGEMMMKTTDI
jgi:hypothetical protein